MREDRINGNDNGMNWNWYPIAGIQNHNPIAIEYSLDSPIKNVIYTSFYACTYWSEK